MKKVKVIIILLTCILIIDTSYTQNLKKKNQQIAQQLYEISMLGGDHIGYAKEILNFLRRTYGIIPSQAKNNNTIYRMLYHNYDSRSSQSIKPSNYRYHI